eukprot:gene27573-50095_t
MLDANAATFVALQLGSRLAGGYVACAARWGTLGGGGAGRLASGHAAAAMARAAASQAAGLAADRLPLRRLYIGAEACHAAAAALLLLPSAATGGGTVAVNAALGVALAAAQPHRLRAFVRVADAAPPRRAPSARAAAAVATISMRDGAAPMLHDPALRLLTLNTVLTNVAVYPLAVVLFPVLLRDAAARDADRGGQGGGSGWMGYAAVVSAGGVLGPVVSAAGVHAVERRGGGGEWEGAAAGVAGQLASALLLLCVVCAAPLLSARGLAAALAAAWAAAVGANNVTTTYFNAHSQRRLPRGARGRFVASLMTVFAAGGSVGALLCGVAADAGPRAAVALLATGAALRAALLVRCGDGGGDLPPAHPSFGNGYAPPFARVRSPATRAAML